MTKVYFVVELATDEIFEYQGLPFGTPIEDVARFVAKALNKKYGGELYAAAQFVGEPEWLWDVDISARLAINGGPYVNDKLKASGGWWKRTLDQIDALTFHHTMSHDPDALARYYVKADHPTMPYTLWIDSAGQVLKCVDLTEGLWHDHTGHENVHLSVGLAGSLHILPPTEAQFQAAAKVAVWAIESPNLPGITEIGDITGHMDWVETACPGWNSTQSGHWEGKLFKLINKMLNERG